MAKKKRTSIVATLGEAVSDVANAVSVAATGSEIGVLELAAEDGFKPSRTKRKRSVKRVPRRRVATKTAKSSTKGKRKPARKRR